MTLIRTNINDWTTVDDRCLKHDGVIVDLGCLGWDWSAYFFGKKRVIGVDPFEVKTHYCREGELYSGLIVPFNCEMHITFHGLCTSPYDAHIYDPSLYNVKTGMSWKVFCQAYGIDSISVLKINIEGGEYPLLHSMDSNDFAQIDQIAVSFHDWQKPEWKNLTRASMNLLISEGFDALQINKEYNWWLFRK
jgi:hypothetical protein